MGVEVPPVGRWCLYNLLQGPRSPPGPPGLWHSWSTIHIHTRLHTRDSTVHYNVTELGTEKSSQFFLVVSRGITAKNSPADHKGHHCLWNRWNNTLQCTNLLWFYDIFWIHGRFILPKLSSSRDKWSKNFWHHHNVRSMGWVGTMKHYCHTSMCINLGATRLFKKNQCYGWIKEVLLQVDPCMIWCTGRFGT